LNFDDPNMMPKICYIPEHEFVKNNTILSLINRIQWLIEKRLEKDPLHNINDLLYCIEIARGMKND
jgi:hypothetical protein